MKAYIDSTIDPYYNIAVEEYLLTEYSEPIFRLWRNSPSIIVGRYQNTLAEINYDFTRESSIPVVRRISGGGTVFHDLGNINFTFIDKKIPGEDSSAMFKRFTRPIIQALNSLGVKAYLEGRNDLLIDGAKFSGNAIVIHKDRVLQHGTLLFSTSIANLSDALKTRPEKFSDKSVKSVVSRVTNISSHLPMEHSDMDSKGFMDYIANFIMNQADRENNQTDKQYQICEYTPSDLEKIQKLRDEKYLSDKWNIGESPKFQYSNSKKYPCGLIDVFIDVANGHISSCKILGDYFFLRPTEELEAALIGAQYSKDGIESSLSSFNLAEYFGSDINFSQLLLP